MFIQVLWETGAVGLFLFITMYYSVWKRIKKIQDEERKKMATVMFWVSVFSLMPGEFLYYGPIFSFHALIIDSTLLPKK
jgi:hypothetical protein